MVLSREVLCEGCQKASQRYGASAEADKALVGEDVLQQEPEPRGRLFVRHHAALGQPFTEPAERLLDARPVQQWRGIAHAASIS